MGETDRAIRIVGPRRLQNQLMANQIEAETRIPCAVCTALSEVLEEARAQDSPTTLVLKEFPAGPDGDLLRRLQAATAHPNAPAHLALFNVVPGSGIETEAVRAGVKGFFYENDAWETLIKGVRAIFAGEVWVARRSLLECALGRPASSPADGAPAAPLLTAREAEVLGLIALGSGNDRIAERLCISPHTAKTHVYRIFQKIGATSRLEAALWAAKNL